MPNTDDRHMIDKRGSDKSVSHHFNPPKERIENFNDPSKENIEERLENEDCRISRADDRSEIS